MMNFPHVVGENLEGRTFRFPDDLERERNLIIIAFQRGQQVDVDTWSPMVERLRREYADLAYYELPIIAALNPLFRWRINSGMRAGIPDRKAREATITLYLDKDAFRHALKLPGEEQIYILIVKYTGEILWQREGVWTLEKGNALEAFLRQKA